MVGHNSNRATAATPAMTAKMRKKSERVVTSIMPKRLLAALPSDGNSVASCPAKTLEAALLMNYTPISSEARCAGESLLTIDSPIGERQSSPRVWMEYSATSHHMEILLDASTP